MTVFSSRCSLCCSLCCSLRFSCSCSLWCSLWCSLFFPLILCLSSCFHLYFHLLPVFLFFILWHLMLLTLSSLEQPESATESSSCSEIASLIADCQVHSIVFRFLHVAVFSGNDRLIRFRKNVHVLPSFCWARRVFFCFVFLWIILKGMTSLHMHTYKSWLHPMVLHSFLVAIQLQYMFQAEFQWHGKKTKICFLHVYFGKFKLFIPKVFFFLCKNSTFFLS